MTGRADMDTVGGDIRCVVTTDKKRVEVVLPPLEMLALSDALRDYTLRAMLKHVTQKVDGISKPLREIER